MKLLQKKTEDDYKEITIETSFLVFKSINTYRKYRDSNTILWTDGNDKFENVGIGKWCDLSNYFTMCDNFK